SKYTGNTYDRSRYLTHRQQCGFAWRHAMFYVMLDGFDHNNGSSTTRPMASIRPKSESVLIENPNSGKRTKVPTSETGTAQSGMRVARQPCRKMIPQQPRTESPPPVS